MRRGVVIFHNISSLFKMCSSKIPNNILPHIKFNFLYLLYKNNINIYFLIFNYVSYFNYH